MAPQLYLIISATAAAEGFAARLMAVLSAVEFSALLVARAGREAASYAELAATVVNIGQGAGCAVLIEDDVTLARQLGADGVHVSAGPSAIKAAVAALKPAMIIGAGKLQSRHDAMTAGEMDIDYVFFETAELAQWWAETFEIPAVLSLPDALPGTVDAHGAEFVALSDSLWTAADPAGMAQALAASLLEQS